MPPNPLVFDDTFSYDLLSRLLGPLPMRRRWRFSLVSTVSVAQSSVMSQVERGSMLWDICKVGRRMDHTNRWGELCVKTNKR
jgi:hypothetical protein